MVSVIVAIVIAAIVYFVILLLLKGLTEEELQKFPKGHLLLKIAKKLRLLQ
jgi:stage V sporulation protein B